MALKRVEIDGKSFEIAYDIVNQGRERQILFLHGWGSNKEVMKSAFANRFADFSLIFVDMPGFGKSPNQYVLTTIDYAEIIKEFLAKSGLAPFAIFGHSFGGKVATLLSPSSLCLLSSSGIVEPKPLKVRAKIRVFKLFKKIFGDSFYKLFATKDAEGMPKNMYETIKNVVDEDFTPRFKVFGGKALIFWGRDDNATHLESGAKIASLIQNSKFYDFEGDHYFFLKSATKIENIFLSSLSN
ncbi:MAG TPA: alpha/beta hydrolase [Campylobacterales bacterium]|nr:alpha/beta hydrolase [Campylobacterales bacterium]